MTKEGEELERLLDFLPSKNLTDIGARLNGSNTWHLVKNHGFKAILADINPTSCEKLSANLDADVRCLKVTPFNVNSLVSEETSILCIDIDGNDYWVWKSVRHKPEIVVIEIGRETKVPDQSWIAPYEIDSPKRFNGTSEGMMIRLGEDKGYRLHKKIGVNLIFLRNEVYETVHGST